MTILRLKVYGIDHKIFWIIFLALQGLLISCMIGTLGAKNWVEMKYDHATWKGDLTWVTDSDIDCISKSSYNDLRSDFCVYKSKCQDTNDAYCEMFKNLDNCGSLYVVLEIIAIICTIIWAIILVCFICSINCFAISFCCSSTSCIFHYIAFLSWMGWSNTNFNGDCDSDIRNSDEAPALCAKDGPSLSLFLVVVFPIILIAFIIIGSKTIRVKRLEAIRGRVIGVSEINNSNQVQMFVQPGYAPYSQGVPTVYPAGQPIIPQPYQYPPNARENYSGQSQGFFSPLVAQPLFYDAYQNAPLRTNQVESQNFGPSYDKK
ncbi:unnamed protein product [Blepharisma stoltei]|uniref:Uncharacterized protein n=1 Tax=Blepharisma stoltei TaxID=1481888 RepID=A0AAU9JEQ2_9CILI|nr:unnamed protein product [Blepharisma stoltei]